MTDVTYMIYYKSDIRTQWDYISFQMCAWHSQFNGFVPHDGISWEGKGLHIHNVDVSSFCADVQPFTLEGQMTERYPAIEECRESKLFVFVIHKRTEPLPYFLPRKASYVIIIFFNHIEL